MLPGSKKRLELAAHTGRRERKGRREGRKGGDEKGERRGRVETEDREWSLASIIPREREIERDEAGRVRQQQARKRKAARPWSWKRKEKRRRIAPAAHGCPHDYASVEAEEDDDECADGKIEVGEEESGKSEEGFYGGERVQQAGQEESLRGGASAEGMRPRGQGDGAIVQAHLQRNGGSRVGCTALHTPISPRASRPLCGSVSVSVSLCLCANSIPALPASPSPSPSHSHSHSPACES